MRCKTLLHKSLLQFYGVTGLLRYPDRGGCSLGMHGSPPKRRENKARRSAARTPLTTFWAAETQLGEPPHCVRSRLRRMQAPQRSSETPRLACKIAPICLIPYSLRQGANQAAGAAPTLRSALWVSAAAASPAPGAKPKPPDRLRASQAPSAVPTLRYGPAGDSAPRLRLRRLVWPKASFRLRPKHE